MDSETGRRWTPQPSTRQRLGRGTVKMVFHFGMAGQTHRWECFSRDGNRSSSFPDSVHSRGPLSFMAVKSQGDMSAAERT